jgi:hypothetical protein
MLGELAYQITVPANLAVLFAVVALASTRRWSAALLALLVASGYALFVAQPDPLFLDDDLWEAHQEGASATPFSITSPEAPLSC